MLKVLHFSLTLFFSYIIFLFFFPKTEAIIFSILVATFSLFPDLDYKIQHRGLFHSLTFIFILLILKALFSLPFIWDLFILGCLFHILEDCLTVTGCPLFYPYKRRFSIPLINTYKHKLEQYILSFLFFLLYFILIL